MYEYPYPDACEPQQHNTVDTLHPNVAAGQRECRPRFTLCLVDLLKPINYPPTAYPVFGLNVYPKEYGKYAELPSMRLDNRVHNFLRADLKAEASLIASIPRSVRVNNNEAVLEGSRQGTTTIYKDFSGFEEAELPKIDPGLTRPGCHGLTADKPLGSPGDSTRTRPADSWVSWTGSSRSSAGADDAAGETSVCSAQLAAECVSSRRGRLNVVRIPGSSRFSLATSSCGVRPSSRSVVVAPFDPSDSQRLSAFNNKKGSMTKSVTIIADQ